MPFNLTTRPGLRPATGLAALKQKVVENAIATGKPIPTDPNTCEHRIGIVFDDSNSMSNEQIADAHAGIEEFLRSCVPDKTSVCVYTMAAAALNLTTELPALAMLVKSIKATGGTPLVQTLETMLRQNNLTRAIVFSDGLPDKYTEQEYAKILATEKPVDTVYISDQYPIEAAKAFMTKLARDTNGIYMHFDRSKSNFRTAFKYLSPGLRHMLADKSFVAKLEGK